MCWRNINLKGGNINEQKILMLMSVILVLAMLFTGCSSPADETENDETAEETTA